MTKIYITMPLFMQSANEMQTKQKYSTQKNIFYLINELH